MKIRLRLAVVWQETVQRGKNSMVKATGSSEIHNRISSTRLGYAGRVSGFASLGVSPSCEVAIPKHAPEIYGKLVPGACGVKG